MSLRKKIAGLTGLTLSSALGITAMGITALSFSTGETFAQGVDEVIVTARKRAESIQDVPVAVTALTPEQLSTGSIQRVQDLQKMVPNVRMQDMAFAGGALSASIRGLAFDDLEKSFEPTVGVVVDGVVAASNAGVDMDLFDLESVEVLRGPQGTLFGRNTIGGVISINRSKPTRELGMKVQVDIEEDSTTELKAVVNFPLGDKGGIKVAVRDLESDSFMYNVTRGETRPGRDLESASIAISYDLADNLTALFTYDYYNDNSEHNLLNITPPAWAFCAGFGHCESTQNSATSDYSVTYQAEPFKSGISGNNMSLNLEWEFDDYTIKSITGYNDFEELMDICSWGGAGTGIGGTAGRPECVFPVIRDQEFEQKSQEFQYISTLDGPLNYTAGLYWLESDSYMDSGPVQNFISEENKEAIAIFGEVYYDLSTDWSVAFGARYTEEEKTLDTANYLTEATKIARDNIGEFTGTYSDENLSYKAVLERNLDFGMAYASVTTGYRSGGWQTRGVGGYLGGANATDTPQDYGPYDAEEVTSYEIGLRADIFDGKGILNVTAFMADYEDKQEVVVTGGYDPCNPTCTFVVNAGDVEISGLEVETKVFVTDKLSLNASVGLLDSEYKEFDYNGTDVSNESELIWAPDSTFAIGFNYDTDWNGGDLKFTGSFNMVDDYTGRYTPLQRDADVSVPSYEALDLSVTYIKETDMGNTMKITLFGNDILEEGGRLARPFDAAPTFTFATPAKRQHFGMSLGLEF